MLWWAVVFFAIFFIGVTKSGFGSGVGLMILPLTAIAMGHIPSRGSEAALGFMLPLLVAGDLLAVWQYRRLFWPAGHSGSPLDQGPATPSSHIPSAPGDRLPLASVALALPLATLPKTGPAVLRRLLPGTIVGLILGAFLLKLLHSQRDLVGGLIRIEIGLESVGLVGLHWWRLYRGVQTRLMPEPWRSHVTGGFSAVSSTLAHAAGPIIAMYLLPLRMDRRLYVGTCAVYFFLLNTAKLPGYAASGMFKDASPLFSLQFLPLVLAGALFGVWLNRRMSDKVFTKVVYAVTFCLGWYVLVEGVMMLTNRRPRA